VDDIEQETGRSSWMNFSTYNFLQLDGLAALQHEDLHFLRVKGCLRVPHPDLLEEFVRSFFLCVHPCLPILDESEFWMSYRGSVPLLPQRGISLFVFQCMMFASVPVRHPSSTITRTLVNAAIVCTARYSQKSWVSGCKIG
jgi:hypothetical protein